jgi:hypothetical protein
VYTTLLAGSNLPPGLFAGIPIRGPIFEAKKLAFHEIKQRSAGIYYNAPGTGKQKIPANHNQKRTTR